MEFIIGAIVIYVLYKFASGKPTPKASVRTKPISPVITTSKSGSSPSPRSASSTVIEGAEDDNFATFTIYTSYGREAEKTSNTQKGRWVFEDEQLTINGRRIPRGFFYFGGVLTTLSGYGIEPSLVDEKRQCN